MDSKLPPHINHVSVFFTDDLEIHKLNFTWRKKNKPTDVLSYSALEGRQAPLFPTLGELVISLDTAKRQANEFGVTFAQEVLRLLIHGTLHLLGYDHEKVPAKDATRMRRLEQKIFENLAPGFRL